MAKKTLSIEEAQERVHAELAKLPAAQRKAVVGALGALRAAWAAELGARIGEPGTDWRGGWVPASVDLGSRRK